MPPNEVNVKVTADNSPLKAGLAESERAVKQSAGKMEADAPSGGKKTVAGINEATKATRALATVMRLVAFPAVIIGVAKTITELILDARDRAKLFNEELAKTSEAFLTAAKYQQILAQTGGAGKVDRAKALADERAEVEKLIKIQGELIERMRIIRELSGISEMSGGLNKNVAAERLRATQKELDAVAAKIKEVDGQFIRSEKAKEELRQKPVRESLTSRINANAAALEMDIEKRAALELAEAIRKIKLESEGETNAEILAMRTKLEKQTTELAKREGDKRVENTRKQIRDIVKELKDAQTEGFSLGDLNFSNSGTGTALETLGNNFVSSFRNHGSGQ